MPSPSFLFLLISTLSQLTTYFIQYELTRYFVKQRWRSAQTVGDPLRSSEIL